MKHQQDPLALDTHVQCFKIQLLVFGCFCLSESAVLSLVCSLSVQLEHMRSACLPAPWPRMAGSRGVKGAPARAATAPPCRTPGSPPGKTGGQRKQPRSANRATAVDVSNHSVGREKNQEQGGDA